MYVIPIHGIIGEPDNEIDKFVTVSDVAIHVNEAKKHESAMLDINSVGGCVDSADKMKALILSIGIPISSRNSGDVASAATQLFCAAPIQNREYNPNKGVFLIHNPWCDVAGDASTMQQAGKELQEIETRYAKDYAKATGADVEVLKVLMSEDKPLTAQQVESLGFASLVYQSIKAVAKLNSSTNINTKQMSDKTDEKLDLFTKSLEKLSGVVSKLIGTKALMLNDASGKEVNLPDINSVEEIAEGVKIEVDGSAYTGSVTLQDGTVVNAENGVVTGVEMQAQGDDVEALKAENEQLKQEVDSLKASSKKLETENVEIKTTAAAIQSEMKEVKVLLDAVKAKSSTGKPSGSNQPSGSGDGKVKKFGYKKTNRNV